MIAIDIVLAAALLGLAWYLLSCRDLFQMVVLYISFGLLMALSWVRLNAPDIALAEAAIGSAVTGALLLAALDAFPSSPSEGNRPRRSLLPLLLCLALAAVLTTAIAGLPEQAIGLRDAAHQELAGTGVNNPVTAVLLGFRGYDTLLEIGVLLVAAMGVFSLANPAPAFASNPSRNPILVGSARVLLPILILTSGYLLWAGADAPGGAFQAGAVLAGAFILAVLVDPGWVLRTGEAKWRWILSVGLLVFLVIGAATLAAGESLLHYRGETSKWAMLAIEAAATVSIGATLLILFLGGTGQPATENSS